MKQTIIFLSIVYCTSLFCQTKEKYRKLPGLSDCLLIKDNDTIRPYYIAQNPITNREYITYLCWLSDVYSNFPHVLLNAFPDLTQKTIDSLMSGRFSTSQINSLIKIGEFNAHYVFNPKYIDYPVIGITWAQAMKFCKWFSDRYNEAILINKGYLHFDPYQKGNESFTTESFIANEYVGICIKRETDSNTKEERNVNWNDHILYPAFRLPSTYEVKTAKDFIKNEFTSYKPNKFLSNWTNYYVLLEKNKITLRVRDKKNVTITAPTDIKNFVMASSYEHYLDPGLSLKKADVFDIYKEYGQSFVEPKKPSKKLIKDSMGQMSYVLIGEDKNSNPVCINKLEYNSSFNVTSDSVRFKTIYRFAVNAVK